MAHCFTDSDSDSDSDSFAGPYTIADSDAYLSSWIPLTKLRVLQVFDCLGGLWQEEWQAPLQLRVLEISGHLVPKSLGLLKHLERIWIHGESVIFGEGSLEDICNLLSLKYLSIAYGGRSLPDSLGNLTKLQHLQLATSSKLERLPHSFGNLTNLQSIDLSKCPKLEQLPDAFENLKRLEFLDLLDCKKLKQLPDNFENLTGLKYLDLTGCNGLTMSIETLENIVTLGFGYRLPSRYLEEFESGYEPDGIESDDRESDYETDGIDSDDQVDPELVFE
jgi:Leucine-rich repeat (LRR) protein